MRKFYLAGLLFLIVFPARLAAQDEADSASIKWVDISRISLSQTLEKNVEYGYIGPNESLPAKYAALPFRNGKAIHKKYVEDENVTRKIILRFKLTNRADTAASVWFYGGYYYWDISLFREKGHTLQPIQSITPDIRNEISYRYLTLAAHDSAVFVAELIPVRTYLNTIRPKLVNPAYLGSFINDTYSTNNEAKTFTYLFCGLLLMMILFSLANFVQGGNLEFLYYSGYAFFVGLMLLIKAVYSYHSSKMSFFQEGYLDYVMLCIGHLFYMLFIQRYLATKRNHPFLHKLYNFGILLLVFSITVYSISHFFTDYYAIEKHVENITKVILLIMVMIFCIYSLKRWKNKLLRFLFWGNLFLFVFALMSQLIISFELIPKSYPYIFRSAVVHYEMGLLLELVFFLAGLNYKNRRQLIASARERERLKAENQMNEYEKEIAIYKAQQQERERISADMHDELGSGMTAIRLMSEIARNKMKENTPVEIEKISHSADEVLNKMNAIIWSMNSGNDTVDNLVSYIRAYAIEYFEYTHIDCRIHTPDDIEPGELTGEKRRNVFLCVKETLNNALKHSKATELRIDITINSSLIIVIHDNGVGIATDKVRQFGNGLKNITKRMESIGGTYEIKNEEGTVTTLKLPLDSQ
ncbi:MAG: 7TM diverse intracellular signaling domain-containing protein [Chitinophagaceae bacterium]